MFIYNVTNKVNHSIVTNWLHWLKEEHIPDIINTGCFTHAIILHILEIEEDDGITFAVQYYTETKANYDRYIREFAPSMRSKALEKWGDRIIAFRSFMEVVN